MDDPGLEGHELARLLAFLRTVNRRLGGVESMLALLREWSVDWPRDRPVTMLDVATGSADLPLAARQWAQGAGFDLRITAIDANPGAIREARRHLGNISGIELIELDARDIERRFGPASFQYVHAGLFLHHLADRDIPVMLRAMDRVASHGIIWNDLVRSRRGWLVWWLLTAFQPLHVRHDARVSYRAGFTPAEVLGHTAAAGITYAGFRSNFNWQRFTLAGNKPCVGRSPAEPNAGSSARNGRVGAVSVAVAEPSAREPG